MIRADAMRAAVRGGFGLCEVQPLEARLLFAWGDLDPTFNGTGFVTTNVPGHFDHAQAVAVQPDGKTVVAGGVYSRSGESDIVLLRYRRNGKLDRAFGERGVFRYRTPRTDDMAEAIAIQADGKIVVAGYTDPGGDIAGDSDFLLLRFNGDGSIDSSFGDRGRVKTHISGPRVGPGRSKPNQFILGPGDVAHDMVLQPDGKIVLVGESTNKSSWVFAVARYNSDGTLDSSFDNDGKLITGFVNSTSRGNNARASAAALDAEGRLVVAGVANGRPTVIRYEPDGTIDVEFGEKGIAQISTTGVIFSQVGDLAVLESGKLLVGGSSVSLGGSQTSIGNSKGFVARFDSEGAVDESFNDDGLAFYGTVGSYHVISVLPLSDGQFLVGGSTYPNQFVGSSKRGLFLALFNEEGELNHSFGIEGSVKVPGYVATELALVNGGVVAVGSEAMTDVSVLSPDLGASRVAVLRFDVSGGGGD